MHHRLDGAHHRPRLLASVRDADEALRVLAAGAHIVDAKEPRDGALGALPAAVIASIVHAVQGRAAVSATTGDLPLNAPELAACAETVARTGVDYVKIGFFGRPDPAALQRCLRALPTPRWMPGRDAPARYIAVLMADQGGVDWPLAAFAAAGFAGVMLDTADKSCGGLRAVLSETALLRFVQAARARALLVGLAGSLGQHDIRALSALQADYLGFRTALCGPAGRSGDIDVDATRALCAAMHWPDSAR